MKPSNIFLIILTAIVTFIGLVCTRLYDKYVKKNIIVQWSLYIFWTLLVLRVLYWVASPIISHIINPAGALGKYISHVGNVLFQGFVQIVTQTNCVVGIGILFAIVMIVCTLILRKAADKLVDNE